MLEYYLFGTVLYCKGPTRSLNLNSVTGLELYP